MQYKIKNANDIILKKLISQVSTDVWDVVCKKISNNVRHINVMIDDVYVLSKMYFTYDNKFTGGDIDINKNIKSIERMFKFKKNKINLE